MSDPDLLFFVDLRIITPFFCLFVCALLLYAWHYARANIRSNTPRSTPKPQSYNPHVYLDSLSAPISSREPDASMYLPLRDEIPLKAHAHDLQSWFSRVTGGGDTISARALAAHYNHPLEWAINLLSSLFPAGIPERVSIAQVENGLTKLQVASVSEQLTFFFILYDSHSTNLLTEDAFSRAISDAQSSLDEASRSLLAKNLYATISSTSEAGISLHDLVNSPPDIQNAFLFSPSRLFLFNSPPPPTIHINSKTLNTSPPCACFCFSRAAFPSRNRRLLDATSLAFFCLAALLFSLTWLSLNSLPASLRLAKSAGIVIEPLTVALTLFGCNKLRYILSVYSPFFSRLLLLEYHKEVCKIAPFYSQFLTFSLSFFLPPMPAFALRRYTARLESGPSSSFFCTFLATSLRIPLWALFPSLTLASTFPPRMLPAHFSCQQRGGFLGLD